MLLLQPDFGAVVVLGIAAMGMLFLAGVPTLRFLLIGLVAVALAALVALAEPYRVARLMSFTDPWADQYGAGYQLTQSLIAFGRGHFLGVGLGNSVQKLFYLPEAHTDFVFAVLAEEWGLLGVLAMLAGFAVLGWRVFLIGRGLEERGFLYHAYLVYGCALVFCAQAFINVGVNMGVLPTKGLTLPFVSYGGSSLLISAAMIGLVLRAGAEQSRLKARGGRNHDRDGTDHGRRHRRARVPRPGGGPELADAGYRILWLGAEGGMETRLVPKHGFEVATLGVGRLRGGGLKRKVLGPLQLLRALLQARRLIRRVKPVLAVGFGGFVSAPGGLAARLAGVPLVIHEQNAVPGLTNRLLSRFAQEALEGFEGR